MLSFNARLFPLSVNFHYSMNSYFSITWEINLKWRKSYQSGKIKTHMIFFE
jgi:hypothetical protein